MLVKEAERYLGWSEPTGDDFFINLYNDYTGAGFPTNVAWCGIFVTVIARLKGIREDIVPNTADCDAGVRWFKNKGRWENSKSQGGSYTPKRNDVVFYSSGHTQNDSTHVGYVVFVNGSTLKAIEGNKSDAVGYRSISLSDPYIIGYGRVADFIRDNVNNETTILDTYTVKSGDTLSEIAQVMGVTTSELAAFNGISNPNVINVGQIIKKPSKTSNSKPNTSSCSELVKAGQIHANNFCGAGLIVDGIRGTNTKRAGIMAIQYAMNLDYNAGLTVDGKWGPKSEAALGNHYVKKGETQYLVTAVEINLYLNKYNPNGVESPGEAGSGFDAAVRQYQKDHGLTADGIAGYNTIKSLIS